VTDYQRTPVEPGVPVVVVDLDSTLADTRGRRHLAPTGTARHTLAGWEPYSLACWDDVPISGMVKLVRLLHGPYVVFLLSARNDVAERETRQWLLAHGVPYDRLRLRGRDEQLGDTPSEWKIKILQSWQDEGWDLALNIDDWAETCSAVTGALGIPSVTPMPPGDNHNPGY
jgi:hypothetical protein